MRRKVRDVVGLLSRFRDALSHITENISRLIRPSEEWEDWVYEPPATPIDDIEADFADILEDWLIQVSPVGDEPIAEERPYYTVRDSTRTGRPSTIRDGWSVYPSHGGGLIVEHQDAERVDWLRFGRRAYDIPARGITPHNTSTMFFWYGAPKRWPADNPGWKRPWVVQNHAIERHVADGLISSDIESEFDGAGDGDFVLVALSEAASDYGDEFERIATNIGGNILRRIEDIWNDIGDEEYDVEL